MSDRLTGISSMATRQVLADLAQAYARESGVRLDVESVGGVDAARRVQSGEAFDAVFLATDAIDKLMASGHVLPGSRVDLMRSGVAVAVRRGAARPSIDTEAALRQAVMSASSIGYSTGPSGAALQALFERWGIADAVRSRTVQAPPGVPVGSLVARGEVGLGFQQLSELMHLEGIDLLGPLPDDIQITTVFSAGICSASTQAQAVRAMLDFMRSPAADAAKQRQGMSPA